MSEYTPDIFPKQQEALDFLSRKSHKNRVLFGGAASGGKSFLIQYWQVSRRIKYPNTRGFIGRNDLGDLREATIPEIHDLLSVMGLVKGVDYHYNGQDMFIEFWNKSKIFFIDLYAYPSDPDFKRFGSLAYTDGAIEEAAEITEKGCDIIYSRIRFRLTSFCNSCAKEGLDKGIVSKVNEKGSATEWICPSCKSHSSGLLPKMLLTCNPDSGHLRTNYYQPFIDNEMPEDRAFVPSLPDDNPYTPESYIKLLESLSEADTKRLRYGDWNFASASDVMFQYANIVAAFIDRPASGEFYITSDIARLGKDKTVICVWHGLKVVEIIKMQQKLVTEVAAEIRRLMEKYAVFLRRVIVDEDGIGGGVKDVLGCVGFLNGGSPHLSDRYSNAKNECYFKLAEYFEMGKVCIQSEYKEIIIKELQAIRRKAPDGDTKLFINSKDAQKILLGGKSPDFADAIMMRMFFEITPTLRRRML